MNNRSYAMRNIHVRGSMLVCLLVLVLSWMSVSHAAEPEITIRVPRQTDTYLSQIIVNVTVDTDQDVQFEISNPKYPAAEKPILLPYSGISGETFHLYLNGDVVSVTSKATDSPQVFRYEINISASSNGVPGTCLDAMPTSTEDWQVRVITAPGGVGIAGMTNACVNSYDRQNGCTNGNIFVDSINFSEVAHLMIGSPLAPAPQLCVSNRPPVDAVLVLDKSGSMNGMVQSGDPTSKRVRLAEAVTDFVDVWRMLRTTLAPGVPYTNPDDRIGLVFFSSSPFWGSEMTLSPPTTEWSTFDGLEDVSSIPTGLEADVLQTIGFHISKVTAGGATSIGDGLERAASVLTNTDGSRKQAILLMSDGRQNTTRMVGIVPDGEPDSGKVRTYNSSGSPDYQLLANQDNYDIYSVTVGTSTAVSPVINQQVAEKTGGFYLNSEDDAGQLRPYFLELLQNFIKFNTYDVVHIARASTSPSTVSSHRFRLSTSSRALSINVLPLSSTQEISVEVIPPGAESGQIQHGRGAIRFGFKLPLDESSNPNGEWEVIVNNAQILATRALEGVVPFDLFVMADDSGVKTDFLATFRAQDSDQVLLTTAVREFGRPLATSGNQMNVIVGKPGVSIGEIIAQSQLPPAPSDIDPQSAAQSVLDAQLGQNPDALVRTSEVIELTDDGDRARGDAVAGDGIYSAYYSPTEVGHYNFLFDIDATTSQSGHLQRMVTKTLYVRPLPDPQETEVRTDPGAKYLSVTAIPKTRYGSRMPGYGAYFWLTQPGRQPIKMTDNLDGSYTGAVPITGGAIPKVSLNFLDVAQVLDEKITPDLLPVTPGKDSVIIDDVQNPDESDGTLCGGCFDLMCHIKKIFD